MEIPSKDSSIEPNNNNLVQETSIFSNISFNPRDMRRILLIISLVGAVSAASCIPGVNAAIGLSGDPPSDNSAPIIKYDRTAGPYAVPEK